MRFLLVIMFFCLLSCKSDKSGKPESNHLVADADTSLNGVKWMYYALNYYGTALFYDSSNKVKVKFPPIECEVSVDAHKTNNADSLLFFCSFKKEGYSFLYVDGSAYTTGIGKTKNLIYPLAGHVIFDYQKNIDSTKRFMEKSDSNFCTYLRNQGNRISPWLRKEAERRNIWK